MREKTTQDNTHFLVHYYTHNGWVRAAWCYWCREHLLESVERVIFRGQSRI